MPEYICNTSPLQYLHQLKSLPLLAALFGQVTVPIGVLIDAKRRALIPAVAPLLDRLNSLNFRVSPATRAAVLALVGE